MLLRDYYNNKFGYNFYLFVDFIKGLEEYPEIEDFLLRKLEDMTSSIDELEAPLYDYLYRAIYTYIQTQNKGNLSFLYEFFEKDFLNLFFSKEGYSLMIDNNIYEGNNPVSIENEAKISIENFDNLDLRLKITMDANYRFIEKYKELGGGKYIQNCIILSKIRKYTELGGDLSFFSDVEENSILYPLYQIFSNGVFSETDINNFYANRTYFENIFYYNYD